MCRRAGSSVSLFSDFYDDSYTYGEVSYSINHPCLPEPIRGQVTLQREQ